MSENTKSKAKKIYNIISTVIFAVVFAFLLFVVIFVSVQKRTDKDVKLFGHYMYVVLTDSMEPTLMTGDAIWCKEVEPDQLKEHDIITFTAPSGPLRGFNITHRIERIAVGEDGEIQIYTRGDNSGGEDKWVLSPDNVKAVYVKSLSFMSALIGFTMKQPFLAYVLLIALPLFLVAALFLISYLRDHFKSEKKSIIEEAIPSVDDLSEEDKLKLLLTYEEKTESAVLSEPQADEICEESSEKGADFSAKHDLEREPFDTVKNGEDSLGNKGKEGGKTLGV